MKKRLIVGITGATGAVYGIEILKFLKKRDRKPKRHWKKPEIFFPN